MILSMNIEERGQVPAGPEASFEDVESGEEAAGAFEAARAKAESFITDIDPDLTVSVSSRRVELDSGKSYTGTVLMFQHTSDPDIRWSMDIGSEPDYIDTKLEGVVRKIYGNIHGEALAERDEAGYEDVDFGDQQFAELQGRERPKTKDENSLIDQANIITNFARQRFNKPGIVVPYEAVHMVKKDKWPGRGSALYNEDLKAMAIREPEKI